MLSDEGNENSEKISIGLINFQKLPSYTFYGGNCSLFFHCRSFSPSIGHKIVETLYSNRVTLEKKRILTPPLSPPFKVGVSVVFYR